MKLYAARLAGGYLRRQLLPWAGRRMTGRYWARRCSNGRKPDPIPTQAFGRVQSRIRGGDQRVGNGRGLPHARGDANADRDQSVIRVEMLQCPCFDRRSQPFDDPCRRVGFGKSTPQQFTDAVRWQAQAPQRRWIFILEPAMGACVDRTRAIAVGHANRRDWWMFRADAVVTDCVPPPQQSTIQAFRVFTRRGWLMLVVAHRRRAFTPIPSRWRGN